MPLVTEEHTAASEALEAVPRSLLWIIWHTKQAGGASENGR